MTSAKVGHRDLANAIRALSMDAVEKAASGHPGLPLGAADIATELFAGQLKYDASVPEWPDRDRFVLSAGHGSMLLYSLLYLTGYEKMPLSELQNFRQLGSRAAGHPEKEPAAGIETTTGPLGQGFANAVGFAVAEARLRSQWGADLVDHRTWALVGDGCLMEGISYEATSLAGHLGLGRLNVIFDDNAISIDGSTDLSRTENILDRFSSCGWHVKRVDDGHDGQAVAAAMKAAVSDPRPSLIACRTRIGWGAPTKEGSAQAHGAPLGADEIAGVRARMDWPHSPFSIPEEILQGWRSIGGRSRVERLAWEERIQRAGSRGQDFLRSLDGANSQLGGILAPLIREWSGECPEVATRVASNRVLNVLSAGLPNLIGGSADLSESNGTRTPDQTTFSSDDNAGSYIHYGVREHAMAAVLNGIVLHGGLIAYGGTFLAFSDYCRPSIRLAALMELPVVFVMTHDSIGLGEDGPTHQPVEQLAALRAIPGLRVYRPADAMETLEAWQCALLDKAPSVLCLTRQKVPFLRVGEEARRETNPTKRGAYLVRESENRDLTLIASGSEVSIALEAAKLVEARGFRVAVVSMPCWELFRQTAADYRQKVLGRGPRLAVEAAVRLGWDEWLDGRGDFIGMEGFGASAPAADLYRHFGITAEAVAERALALIARPPN